MSDKMKCKFCGQEMKINMIGEHYSYKDCANYLRDENVKLRTRLAELELRWIYGGNGSHWDGCAEVHWDCKIAQLEAENAQLKKRLAELEDANRWIPVTERLPEAQTSYEAIKQAYSALVHVYPRPTVDRAVFYDHDLEKWSCSAEVKVTHWRPMPPPVKDDK